MFSGGGKQGIQYLCWSMFSYGGCGGFGGSGGSGGSGIFRPRLLLRSLRSPPHSKLGILDQELHGGRRSATCKYPHTDNPLYPSGQRGLLGAATEVPGDLLVPNGTVHILLVHRCHTTGRTIILSRKLKSHYGARNRFQEPSLELSLSKLRRLAGRYDNSMPTWSLATIAGLKLPTLKYEILQKKPLKFVLHAIGEHIVPQIFFPPKVLFSSFFILTFSYLSQVVYDMTTFFVLNFFLSRTTASSNFILPHDPLHSPIPIDEEK
jgi:hypothetical protein